MADTKKRPLTEFETTIFQACELKGLTLEELSVKLGVESKHLARGLNQLKARGKVRALVIDKQTRYFSGRSPYIKAATALNNARYAQSRKRYELNKLRWSEYTLAAQLGSIAYRDRKPLDTVKICGGCGMAVQVNEAIAAKLSGLAITLPGFVETHLGKFNPETFSGSYDKSWFIEAPDGSTGVFVCCDSCRLITELLGPWFWAEEAPTYGASSPLGVLLLRLLEIVLLRDENPRVKLGESAKKFSLSKRAVKVLTLRARQVKGIAAAITARTSDSMEEVSPLQEDNS